jgi:hypothetical protein
MPGSDTGTFIDPDDYQARLRRARIDLLVTSQGAFNARLTWITLHHMQLLRSEEGRSSADGTVRPDCEIPGPLSAVPRRPAASAGPGASQTLQTPA